MKIRCCVELDDGSHLRDDRVKRDNFVNKLFDHCEIELIRIPLSNSDNDIKNYIFGNMQNFIDPESAMTYIQYEDEEEEKNKDENYYYNNL